MTGPLPKPAAGLISSVGRMEPIAPNITAYDTALARKHHGVPTVDIKMPAIIGPTMAPIWTRALFVATAFVRSSSPTIRFMSPWRMGGSNADAAPCSNARTRMRPIVAESVKTRTVRMVAWAPRTTCSASTARRTSIRSARVPAQAPRRSGGRNWAPPTRPTYLPLFVCSRTSHARAMFCSHVPPMEAVCPTAYRRNARVRKAGKREVTLCPKRSVAVTGSRSVAGGVTPARIPVR